MARSTAKLTSSTLIYISRDPKLTGRETVRRGVVCVGTCNVGQKHLLPEDHLAMISGEGSLATPRSISMSLLSQSANQPRETRLSGPRRSHFCGSIRLLCARSSDEQGVRRVSSDSAGRLEPYWRPARFRAFGMTASCMTIFPGDQNDSTLR